MDDEKKRYRWATPHEWLTSKVDASEDVAYLRGVARSLIGQLDSDDIQDTFQSEMDRDGYFDPVEETTVG